MKKIYYILVATVLIFAACSDDSKDEAFTNLSIENMPAASYMAANDSTFSLWVDLLKYTELYSTLNLNKDYTCFVPDNKAMESFLQKKGISDIEQLDKTEALNLVKYHTIQEKKYTTSNFSDGMLPDSTASGDYLSLEIREGGFDAMYVNGEARISSFNIETTNAVIHVLESVLTPVVGTIVDKLDTDYSIMKDLLEQTGYVDSLNTVYKNGVKSRYTLFVVPDEVFQNKGINSVNSLAGYLGETGNDYKSIGNKVNQYAAYHILSSTMAFSDLNDQLELGSPKNIATLDKSQLINCSLQGDNQDFYLNYNSETNSGVEITKKNVNCKNGVIHVVNDIMPVVVPAATKVIWDLTDYKEVADLCADYQKENMTETVETYFSYDAYPECYRALRGPSSYRYVLVGKDEEMYKNAVNHDYLYLNLSTYGWIEMVTPTIIAGKYKVSVEHFNLSSKTVQGKLSMILDGDYVGGQFTTYGNSSSKSSRISAKLGEVEFTESTSHIVRFLAGDSYPSYLDCVTFEPVKEKEPEEPKK